MKHYADNTNNLTVSDRIIADEVHKILIDMAIEGELDSDINDLAFDHIFAQAKVNKKAELDHQIKVVNASQFLSEGGYEDVLNYKGDRYDLVDDIEGVTVWEPLEQSLNIKTFLDSI